MNIEKTISENRLTVALEGRLDTNTSPELEKVLDDSLNGVTALEFDLAGLDYISSAGLRLLLRAQKIMNGREGLMTVRNVNGPIMEIFDITGFAEILTIE